jgi:hypothetical protein
MAGTTAQERNGKEILASLLNLAGSNKMENGKQFLELYARRNPETEQFACMMLDKPSLEIEASR